jgi:hypothetical protein
VQRTTSLLLAAKPPTGPVQMPIPSLEYRLSTSAQLLLPHSITFAGKWRCSVENVYFPIPQTRQARDTTPTRLPYYIRSLPYIYAYCRATVLQDGGPLFFVFVPIREILMAEKTFYIVAGFARALKVCGERRWTFYIQESPCESLKLHDSGCIGIKERSSNKTAGLVSEAHYIRSNDGTNSIATR